MAEVDRRRSGGTIAMVGVLVLLAANALLQAISALAGWNTDPPLLTTFQFASGGSALAAAVGTWRGARWAPYFALGYGIITGIMIASLGRLLELDADARAGLPLGAVIVVLISITLAYLIRRSQRASAR